MLELELGFSRTLTALLVLAHSGSLVLIWLMPLWIGLKLGISLTVAASCIFHVRRDCLRRGPNAVNRLKFDRGGGFSYQTRDGEWREASVLGTSLVNPWLSVLSFRPEGVRGTRHTVLFPDTLDPAAYRRLRVLLKWGNPPASA